MTKQQAEQIIIEENLKNYNWFGNHPLCPDEVEITKKGELWTVATASERTTRESKVNYSTESEALEDFIERLRGDKEYRESVEAYRRRNNKLDGRPL